MRSRLVRFGVAAAVLAAAAALLALPAVRLYWKARSSNPVRRGITIATEMGCFSCHGPLGAEGVPDPSLGEDVPPWSGGVWMMYVKDEAEVREFVLDGVSAKRAASGSARAERERAEIRMPAFRDRLSARETDDVVAAFLVLSGMKRPQDGTLEARGLEVARERRCFSCHGPGGSGGLPNPGSFVGFIPGWYGADWRDLVRDRAEFDAWVRDGTIPRLATNPIARRFLDRQKIRMPRYRDLPAEDLDALWAYASWLEATRGGLEAETRNF